MTAKILAPDQGEIGRLRSMGVRFMIKGTDSGGGFSMVEHPLGPRALAGPLHRHSREDEYSFVLDGQIGAMLDDEVVHAGPGDLLFKPRNEWHTFWNAGDTDARILEIISPSGFEKYFQELIALFAAGVPDPAVLAEVASRYGLEVDLASIPTLSAEHGLG
jgi:quercetin dioxygenase-like cupin family protein